ncbi:unnamed protein product [Periconia digitata]|uniref:Uncharacterized protein n=1 Tax=Periconia digitata TaxID=1303443 RepID=A0A9W4XS46_9PLEO|nr:unnamed protein product [Periconia digitata]
MPSTFLRTLATLLMATWQTAMRLVGLTSSHLAALPNKELQAAALLLVPTILLILIQEPEFILIPARQLRVGVFAMTCGFLTCWLTILCKDKMEDSKRIQVWLNGPTYPSMPAEYEKDDEKQDLDASTILSPPSASIVTHASGVIGPSPHPNRARNIAEKALKRTHSSGVLGPSPHQNRFRNLTEKLLAKSPLKWTNSGKSDATEEGDDKDMGDDEAEAEAKKDEESEKPQERPKRSYWDTNTHTLAWMEIPDDDNAARMYM